MTDWQGMNRKTTPVDDTHGVGHFNENPRLVVRGEQRRRHGFSRSSIAKIATPVYGISSLLMPVPGIVLQGSTGDIDGYNDFTPVWGDMILLAPTGTAVSNGGYVYITGDSVSHSQNYSVAAAHSGTDNIATFTDAPIAINTGGANGEFYVVTFALQLLMTNVSALSLNEISLTAVLSQVSTITAPGTSNTWSFTGGTSGVQGNQSTTTLEKTQAIKGFSNPTFPIVLTGATRPYTVNTFNTWLMPGGTTITSTAYANLLSGLAVAYTITGHTNFATLKRQPGASTSWTVTVNRAEAFDTSYDIYAGLGFFPNDPSDGIYITNLPINPGSASTAATVVTVPSSASTWKFVAVPRNGSAQGPAGRLSP